MFAALYPLTMLVGAQFVTGFSDTVHQFFFGSPNKRFFVLSWTLDFLSLGVLSSLLFLRVLPCLVTTVMATSLLPLNMIWTIEGRLPNSFDWAIRLGVVPLLALLASLWLVQTWDENRWPRFIERLLGVWGRNYAVRCWVDRGTYDCCWRRLRANLFAVAIRAFFGAAILLWESMWVARRLQ